ncbi:MAG: helix-turn-helix domain-containing protein [Erythrobacter sp.]|uniref:helix-turn-helix domain-containing protein n=1 Tax=Erythrobacter sp. TaxID=1042 RepID=UPI002612CB7E|nr:helix-turn-helix domain-containing protein [Erythrobacter sp.]MDJ0979253.1 helix-turn-helix domain-containing protein [Erythrobacter sp.]
MADKYRRKKEPRHIRLYHSITGSEAWLDLSGNAVKVLIALARFDDGQSNGKLYFSERTGAKETGLSRNTVKRCLAELIEHGFIAQTKPGAFNRNNLLAATYRLTWVAAPGCNPSAPTRDFEKWKHGNSQAQILTPSGSNSDSCMCSRTQAGSIPDTHSTETSHVSNSGGGSNIGPQIIYQREGEAELETNARKQANPTSGAFLGELRERLVQHLQASEPGEQSRLADTLDIPGGTLSKFVNGKNLPDHHRARLADALA